MTRKNIEYRQVTRGGNVYLEVVENQPNHGERADTYLRAGRLYTKNMRGEEVEILR